MCRRVPAKGKAQGWMKIMTTGYMRRMVFSLLCYGFGKQEVRVFLCVLCQAKCSILDRFLRLYL